MKEIFRRRQDRCGVVRSCLGARALSFSVTTALHRPTPVSFLRKHFTLVISSGFNEVTQDRIQINWGFIFSVLLSKMKKFHF